MTPTKKKRKTKRFRCAVCHFWHDYPIYAMVGLSKTCSRHCADLLRNRRGTSWKSVRCAERTGPTPKVQAEVLERDNNACRFCGTNRDLHLHHIIYRSSGGTHVSTNLITLCATHHNLVHDNKSKWQPVCQQYIRELRDGRQRYLASIQAERERRAGREDRHA